MSKNRGSRPPGRSSQPSRGGSTSGGRGKRTGGAGSVSSRGRTQARPQGGQPRRERDNARWVVGLHACAETLRVRPRAIREIWLREDFRSSESLRELAESAEHFKIPIKPKAVSQLDAVGSGHQGVALAATEQPELDWEMLKSEGQKIVVILDGIEDPHNLGSVLRTAWLTGVVAVLIPEDRAVGLTPAVCKIASGGAEHVPVESHSNLASVISDLKEAGFWIYGLAEAGTQRPWDLKLPEKVAWIIGSEGSGMRITTERACDELVRIPQVQTGSSYNASIALSMVLAETCRQFGNPE